MTTIELKKKLHDYIDIAEERKLKAIYTILEGDIEETYNWEDDKELLAELDRREAECLKDDVKSYSLEEVMARVKESVKNVHNTR